MKRAGCIVAFLCSLAAGQSAFAHATPLEYEPASSSVAERVPAEVRIRFSERLEPSASSITVFGPGGLPVDDGTNRVESDNPRTLATGLSGTATGSYAVSWQVVSADDGHFTRGAYVFSVGAESETSAAGSSQLQVVHRSGWPEAILIWLELLGEAVLLGVLTLIVVIGHRMARDGMQAETEALLRKRITLLVAGAALLIVTGTIGYLWLKSANLSFDRVVPMDEAFRAFLPTLVARAALQRLALSIVLVIGMLAGMGSMLRPMRLTMRDILFFALIIAVALLRARVSHAAASEFLPVFSVAANGVHLFFKDLWIGCLIALVVAFLPALEREGTAKLTLLTLLSASRIVMLSLFIGGITGLYIIWLHLKGFANLLTTHWGGMFLALGASAAVFLVFRLFHEWSVAPALVRHLEGNAEHDDRDILRSAHGALVVETIVGIGILLFSSMLIITSPPLTRQAFFEQTAETPVATITLSEHRFEEGKFLVSVARKKGTSSSGTLTVTLMNDEKGVGPIIATTEQRFVGGNVFPVALLSPPGNWTVEVTEQEPNTFDAVARFTIRMPEDLAASSRTFGRFEAMLLATCAAMLLLTYLLHRANRRLEERTLRRNVPVSLPALQHHPWRAGALGLLTAVFIGVALAHDHGNAAMKKACRRAGGLWHESIPLRDGRATAETPVLGCMMGSGLGTFHIADPRELAFFLRRADAYATLETDGAPLQAKKPTTLSFRIVEGTPGAPIRGLTLEHDRILHAVAVNDRLQHFQHIHVEDATPVTPEMLEEGVFPVQVTFPEDGTYLIGVDFTVRAQTFAQRFIVPVGNEAQRAEPVPDTQLEGRFDPLDVALTVPREGLRAGTMQKLVYRITENGAPVTDLEPYLAAPMHISAVRTDLRTFLHTHAELPQPFLDRIFRPRDPNAKHAHVAMPARFGPTLIAYVLFPVAGDYVLFGEVQRNGKIILTRFVVHVV